MEFEWDEAKAENNLAKHGLTFGEAVAVFNDPRHIDVDSSAGHLEQRRRATGRIETRTVRVIYTMRDGRCRLISARAARKQEIEDYGNRQIHP